MMLRRRQLCVCRTWETLFSNEGIYKCSALMSCSWRWHIFAFIVRLERPEVSVMD